MVNTIKINTMPNPTQPNQAKYLQYLHLVEKLTTNLTVLKILQISRMPLKWLEMPGLPSTTRFAKAGISFDNETFPSNQDNPDIRSYSILATVSNNSDRYQAINGIF